MNIFLSYSHHDEVMCKRLEGILRLQERDGGKLWRDDQISPGVDWNAEIARQLQTADIVVLLLSSAFFDSQYIPENELKPALARHEAKTARVVPVLLTDFDWRRGTLGALQALPTGAKPISQWPSETDAMLDIAHGLRKVAAELSNQANVTAFDTVTELLGSHPPVKAAVAGCSNLLRTSSQQIGLVADYKTAHDLLHVVQFQCYIPVRNLAPRFPEDADACADTGRYDVTLQTKTEEFETLAGSRQEPDILTTLAYLRQARDHLHNAVERDDSKELQCTVVLLGGLLGQFLPQIAVRLDAAVDALDLLALRGELSSIAAGMAALCIDPRAVQEVETGARQLGELQERLKQLSQAHKRWQSLDSEFRMAEAALVRDFGEFSIFWPALRESLIGVCNGQTADWATAIAADLEKLQDAADSAKARRFFPRLHQRGAERFFRVDLELKALTEEIRAIDEPLKRLLERMGG